MQLVNLALLGQLQQMRLIVGVEVHGDRLVSSIGRDETNIEIGLSTDFGLIVGSSETNGVVLVAADDVHLRLSWLFPSHLVEELDGLTGLLLDVEAEGLSSDTKVQPMSGLQTHQHQDNQAEIH